MVGRGQERRQNKAIRLDCGTILYYDRQRARQDRQAKVEISRHGQLDTKNTRHVPYLRI
jgi:hypothetical protein